MDFDLPQTVERRQGHRGMHDTVHTANLYLAANSGEREPFYFDEEGSRSLLASTLTSLEGRSNQVQPFPPSMDSIRYGTRVSVQQTDDWHGYSQPSESSRQGNLSDVH
jgi:hypothetical protein